MNSKDRATRKAPDDAAPKAPTSRVEAARLAAAERNGDILALRALDRAREAAFRRGDIKTRLPSRSDSRRGLPVTRNDPASDGRLDQLGDDVATPGPGWGDVGSGPRPSHRDPHALADILTRAVKDFGWGHQLDMAAVTARWEEVVGPNVARHVTVVSFGDDGVLTLQASSSSWEAQIKALLATLHARLNAEVGTNVVKQIVVQGPRRPSWKHGRYSVPGRGPRDTYG